MIKQLFTDDITGQWSLRRIMAGILFIILVSYCFKALLLAKGEVNGSEFAAIFGTLFGAIAAILGIIGYTTVKQRDHVPVQQQ